MPLVAEIAGDYQCRNDTKDGNLSIPDEREQSSIEIDGYIRSLAKAEGLTIGVFFC